jgi:2-dehydropantoate 2-reductase
MRILVIGAGATGGFYGGRLAHAGRDVTFLVRGKRAEALRKNGLTVVTPTETFTIQPKLISAAELSAAGAFDLILLSVKAYAFDAAVRDFAAAVGSETMILPVLNGMRHLDALDARFGSEHVLGGLCRIIGDMDADGRVLQMTPLNDLVYGERSKEVTPRIEAVDAQLKGVGFNAKLAPDILSMMWFKWMLLCSQGTINTLARGTTGQVRAVELFDEIGLRFQTSVLEETMAVAKAHGYPPSPELEHILRTQLTERDSPFTTSMYRDLIRGNPVEADQIVGDMISRARKLNVATPLIEAAYVQLRVYEDSRK